MEERKSTVGSDTRYSTTVTTTVGQVLSDKIFTRFIDEGDVFSSHCAIKASYLASKFARFMRITWRRHSQLYSETKSPLTTIQSLIR
jgi:hypothetical protein